MDFPGMSVLLGVQIRLQDKRYSIGLGTMTSSLFSLVSPPLVVTVLFPLTSIQKWLKTMGSFSSLI